MSLAESSATLWETGLYGKLPSQGDFVVRRLPRDFVGPWDDWLQACMSRSRRDLGETWEQAYQDAPVWRFVLASGEAGPGAWAGVLQPGVDRVGRYFPMTVAARIAENLDPLATLFRSATWHESIEQAAETAFDAATGIEDLDRRIQRIGFPPDCAAPLQVASDTTLPIAGRAFSALSLQVEPGDTHETLSGVLYSRFLSLEHASCAWLTAGTPTVGPALLMAKTLPSGRQFCGLLVGRWEEHGWELVVRTPQLVPAGHAPHVGKHGEARMEPEQAARRGLG